MYSKLRINENDVRCTLKMINTFVQLWKLNWNNGLSTKELGICIPGYEIQREALTRYNLIHPLQPFTDFVQKCALRKVTFRASRGWLSNFCLRHDLVLRRISTTGRDLPTNAINRIYEFFNYISNLISTYDLTDA